MAKAVQKRARKAPNMKAVAALTLVVALVLTVASGIIGLTGMKLDKEGLHKLLAWIPSPLEGSSWQKALLPGADLGPTLVLIFDVKPITEGEEITAAQKQETIKTLSQRLAIGGWHDAQVELLENGQLKMSVPDNGTHGHAYEMMAQRGEIGFATPEGEVFLTQKNIVRAVAQIDPRNQGWSVGFATDAEGKTILAEKTATLLGKTMSLMMDGRAVISPNIGYQALTEGQASLPVPDQEQAVAIAAMMSTQPLPLSLTHVDEATSAPLLGEGSLNKLIIALCIASLLIAIAFVVYYRLGGFVAAWLLIIQLIATWFLAALIRSGFSISTLLAVYGSFGLLAFCLTLMYRGMKQDLVRGRSIRQTIREGYGGQGKLGMEIVGALLLLCVVLIIMDNGLIGNFARVFGLGLLVDFLLLALVHRGLLLSVVNLFGTNTALYSGGKKEVA